MINFGEPETVEWYREGRIATRDECDAGVAGVAGALPWLGAESAGGAGQSLRMGFRLRSGPNVEMGLELGRRENGLDAPEHAIQLNCALRW